MGRIYIYTKKSKGVPPSERTHPAHCAQRPRFVRQCSVTDRSHCFPRQQHSVTARHSQARLYNIPMYSLRSSETNQFVGLNCRVCVGEGYTNRCKRKELLLFYQRCVAKSVYLVSTLYGTYTHSCPVVSGRFVDKCWYK